MWNDTVIADAPPVIVLVVSNICRISRQIVELAAMAVVVCNAVLEPAVPIPSVKVAAVAAVLVMIMLVTAVLVEAGTVYRTVVVVVVAAPLNSFLSVLAIRSLPLG